MLCCTKIIRMCDGPEDEERAGSGALRAGCLGPVQPGGAAGARPAERRHGSQAPGKAECEEQVAALDIRCLRRILDAQIIIMTPSSYTVLFTHRHVGKLSH